MARVVDVFAGPGGWDEGLRRLDVVDVVGVEWDTAACETAGAAGHRRVQADVAAFPPERFAGFDGVVGSPPCPTFSQSGSRTGWAILDVLAAGIGDLCDGTDTRAQVAHKAFPAVLESVETANSRRRPARRLTDMQVLDAAHRQTAMSVLVLEPARWMHAIRPRWAAFEQVPAVLPLWHVLARGLAALGYSSWAGILCAADYGVPQTRQRAVLIARLDGPAGPPEPTHGRHPDDLFGSTRPWVSMGAALGSTRPWVSMGAALGYQRPAELAVLTGANTVKQRKGGRRAGDPGVEAYERPTDQPAPTVKTRTDQWTIRTAARTRPGDGTLPRRLDRPAPTVAFGHAAASWVWERPATTVAGDARIQPPGHKMNADDPPGRYETRAGANAIRVADWEAGVLQDFPADYPWQGNKTKRFEQIGNAFPPGLAAAVCAPLLKSV